MPVMEVTVACGFQSSSHFSKAYRGLFGYAPSQERLVHAGQAARRGQRPGPKRLAPLAPARKAASVA